MRAGSFCMAFSFVVSAACSGNVTVQQGDRDDPDAIEDTDPVDTDVDDTDEDLVDVTDTDTDSDPATDTDPLTDSDPASDTDPVADSDPVTDDDPLPSLTVAAIADVSVHVGQSAALSATVSNAVGELACAWTNDQDTAVIADCALSVSPLVTTTYTITVTDDVGSASDTVTVVVLGDLVATAGDDLVVTSGAALSLTASASPAVGGLSCVWTNSVDAAILEGCSVVVRPVVATTYTVVVTDSSGATDDDVISVTLLPLVVVAGATSEAPAGSTITRTATWTGATVCSDASECGGATCELGACVVCTWQWRAIDGKTQVTTTGCTIDIPVSDSLTYSLVVTDTVNGNVAEDTTTIIAVDGSATLCAWDVVNFEITGLSNGRANYTPTESACTAAGQSITQNGNADPSFAISDMRLDSARVETKVRVASSADDDIIGVAWGYQDPQHFYMLSWKKAAQTAPATACGPNSAGLSVVKVAGTGSTSLTPITGKIHQYVTQYEFACADFWVNTRSQAALLGSGTTLLYSVDDPGAYTTGWAQNVTYRVVVYTTASRSKVLIYNDATDILLRAFTVNDADYAGGEFGVYTHSQDQTTFSDVRFRHLSDFSVATTVSGTSVTATADELAVPPYACVWADDSGATVGSDCSLSGSAGTHYTVTVTDDFGRTSSAETTL